MIEKIIDLSHVIDEQTITYKGLPAPIICDYLSRKESEKYYQEGTTFQIGKIEMVSNTGTYIDVPFHRFAEGEDLAQVSIERLVNLNGVCIDVSGLDRKAIGKEVFDGYEVKEKAVLIFTNWSRHWGTDSYFEAHPYLTHVATYLSQQKVTMVGIDSHNIDDTLGNQRPVHTILLGEGIPIVEHLTNLSELTKFKHFVFHAAPPKILGMGTFPVRAFAVANEHALI
ncbi:cyclase family protein [Catalinimonas sp. 4WD22]|uniref:cyclase family protein n=1 Tax=Catalinimonas locisalis TaxID=3133978 RepID=UPI003101685A